MKKRICFVGLESDPKSPASLKQAMSMAAWDSTFVSDANNALAAMTAAPFDAVVTVMRMPGMTGAELLQQVGKLQPNTLRFVLGDVADQEQICNCVGGPHQFIPQPCTPQTLASIIQRSLALDAWLSTDQLRKIIPQLRRLPTLPLTYFEVLKQVEAPNATVQSIGEVIARDPSATARLLQMVNSATFGLSEKITDPVHAVSLLGVETVKSLVLCLQVFSQGDEAKQAGLSFEQLWDHSFLVGRWAREIAKLQTGDPRHGNDAFTAGLLHDVGRIVLASNLPKEYAAVVTAARQQGRLLFEEEAAQFGVTHAQVGAYLLGLWGMPTSLVEAAALHHSPSQTSTPEFSALTAVHIANVFAHEKDLRREGFSLPKLDIGYLNTLGIMDKTEAWRRSLAGDTSALDKSKAASFNAKPVGNRPTLPSLPAIPTPAAAKSAAPARRNWLGWVLAPTAAVAVIAAILWWFSHSNSTQEVRARTPSGNESTSPTLDPKSPARNAQAATPQISSGTNVVVATRGFDSLKVQAIFYRASNPNVMINGKTLGVGERINGVEIVAIAQTNVILAYGRERRSVALQIK
jgi:HD-like signal output (HDOD) protein